MDNNTDLPHQPDTPQQPPQMKNKGNHSWKTFYILLILINLLFVGFSWTTFLIPLAIIDFIAIRSYIKKQSPPWKVFFISLFVLNAIFVLFSGWTLSQPSGAIAGILIFPFALILLIIDFIAIITYGYSTHKIYFSKH